MASRHQPQKPKTAKPKKAPAAKPAGEKTVGERTVERLEKFTEALEGSPEAAAAMVRQGEAPICPYCKEPCQAGRTEAYFTRYYCKEPTCSFSAKIPRQDLQARLRRDRAREEDHSARP